MPVDRIFQFFMKSHVTNYKSFHEFLYPDTKKLLLWSVPKLNYVEKNTKQKSIKAKLKKRIFLIMFLIVSVFVEETNVHNTTLLDNIESFSLKVQRLS